MIRSLAIVLVLFVGFVACKKKKEENTPEFNKSGLLSNVADNIIIPAIDAFDAAVAELDTRAANFEQNPGSLEFDLLKEQWLNCYLLWQAVKIYDFGPMMDHALKSSIGTFPSDTSLILDNINSGSYNLGSASNVDAIGFSALDFLLYRYNALSELQSNANYLLYVNDVVDKLKSESAQLKSLWANYRSSFVASTGTGSTSSFSLLVNAFNKDYELAKNAKLGIPLGKQSLGIQLPEYVEARYSAVSFQLLKTSIDRLHQLYRGVSFNGSANDLGFEDYLIHLEKSSLASTISTRFTSIKQEIDWFSMSLESALTSNTAELDALHTLIAGQVVYIKTDMTSAFGVLISYQDNDGD